MRWMMTFLRYKGGRVLAVKALILAGYYRICILFMPIEKMKQRLGTENQESPQKVSDSVIPELARISHVVDRVCNRTPWQSKCLVRALTAQRLLKESKLESTLYLGVAEKDNQMIAHAWLRCGEFYITGGDGRNFATVSRIRCS